MQSARLAAIAAFGTFVGCGGHATEAHEPEDESVRWVRAFDFGELSMPNLITASNGDALIFGFERVAEDADPRSGHGNLIRVAPDGTVRWKTRIGGAVPPFGSNIAAAGEGIFLTVLLEGPLVIEDELTSCGSGESRVVVAFDAEGRSRWARCIAYPYDLYDGFVSADPDGTITFASSWMSDNNVFVQRLSADGDESWSVTGHNGDITGPASDGAGGLFIAGTGALPELTGNPDRTLSCAFWTELSSEGNVVRSHEIGCTGSAPNQVVASPAGGVVVSTINGEGAPLTSFDPDGQVRWSQDHVGQFNRVNFAQDSEGNVYAEETDSFTMRSISPSGATRLRWRLGHAPKNDARPCFQQIAARAIDDLYVLGRWCPGLRDLLPEDDAGLHGVTLARLLLPGETK